MIQNIRALPNSLMVLLRSLLYSTNDDGKRRHMKTSSNDHRTLDILFKPSVSDPLSTLLMWKRPNKDLRYNKERFHHHQKVWTLETKSHCHFQNISSLEMFAVYSIHITTKVKCLNSNRQW